MAKQTFLGELELLILLTILQLGEGAYGVPIAMTIQKRTGRAVALGSIYGALERLEQASLVRSRTGESTPERGGRAKRYFEVTESGLGRVRDTQTALMGLWKSVPQLKGSHA